MTVWHYNLTLSLGSDVRIGSWLLGEEVSLEVGVEVSVSKLKQEIASSLCSSMTEDGRVGVETSDSFLSKCSGAIHRTKLYFHCRINPTFWSFWSIWFIWSVWVGGFNQIFIAPVISKGYKG